MQNKTTFFSEQNLTCPICKNSVRHEVLRSGGGRLDSSNIQKDLRQQYTPSKKFGIIYPLIYDIIVCSSCWFAALEKDFLEDKFDHQKIHQFEKQRKTRAKALIKNQPIDFNNYRQLPEGLVSYYLAVHCYHFYIEENTIEVYKGLFSLRASWCAKDLAILGDEQDYLYTYFYFRYLAAISYENYVTKSENGALESNIDFYGPDVSVDFGFRGLVYISAYLGDEFSELIKDVDDRYVFLTKLIRRLSKVFSIGRKSKGTPSQFLDMVHILYEDIRDKAKKIQVENNMLTEEILEN